MNGTVADIPVPFKARKPMPIGQVVRAYLVETKFETLRMLRTLGIAIPFLALPVPCYLLFGVLFARNAVQTDPWLSNYLFESWSVFGVMGPAIFGAGITLAVEREGGILKLKRALPMPPMAYLLAKFLMAMVFATAVMISLVVIAAWVGKVSLTPGQLLALAAINIVGAVPFCAIGLFIGSRTTASSAPAFANLAFLPMLWLSGLFLPLPGLLQLQAPIWPAWHLSQLALAAIGERNFGSGVANHLIFLIGVTVVFAGLAIRRLRRVG
jgi:ABC-2 type transport system permease protein